MKMVTRVKSVDFQSEAKCAAVARERLVLGLIPVKLAADAQTAQVLRCCLN
jgi:hypothetical protein